MIRNLKKTNRLIGLLAVCIVSVNGYGQAFSNAATVSNSTPNPIYVHGNTTTGVYIGKGGGALSNSLAIGSNSFATTNAGDGNIAVGNGALLFNNGTAGSSGSWNVAVGYNSLIQNTTGNSNVACGLGAIGRYSVSSYNTALGWYALGTNHSGSITSYANNYNTALGYGSLIVLRNGVSNSSVGANSLNNLDSGVHNVAVGNAALGNLTSGNYNVGIGSSAQVGSSGDYQLSIQNVIYGRSMTGWVSGNGVGNVAIGRTPQATTAGGIASNSGSGLSTGSYVRLQVAGTLGVLDVPNATNTIGKYLFVDANGVVNQAYLPLGCTTANRIPVSTGSSFTCSQIYDDGVSVGIGTAYNSGTPNFGYTYTGTSDWHVGSSNPTINSTGNLKLAVDGIVKAWVYYATSDARYKKNIKTLGNVISTIKLLKGVSYDWNKDAFPSKDFSAAPQIGFIAQEVEKIIPQAVIRDKDGYYAMNYSTIIPVLTEGIKEQQTQIETQSLEIENLKTQVVELRNKLSQLTPGEVKIKLNSIEVVPNPITGISVVSYKLDNANAASFLIVSDLQGKLLKQISLAKNQQQGQVQVSKKDLPNGMYVFTIVSGNAEVQSKKVLVSE